MVRIKLIELGDRLRQAHIIVHRLYTPSCLFNLHKVGGKVATLTPRIHASRLLIIKILHCFKARDDTSKLI